MKRAALVVLAALVSVGLWQALVVFFDVPDYLVPTPVAVFAAALHARRLLAVQAGMTLGSAGLGLAISMIFALVFALAFSASRRTSQAAMPILLIFRSIPVIAVAPLITLFLGRGIGTSVVVVTIVSFFPILVNLMRGLASAEPGMLELMHVYGASTWTRIRVVRAPYAVPHLFVGLRVAGSGAILGAMLSEWITGAHGLGKLILDTGEMRETELLWAAVLTSVAAALAVFALTSAGEAYATRWKKAGSTLKES
jgi:ABC-type nitrate/sulfonate/bicarbonate transport system permease component